MRFSSDDALVFSAGGTDRALMQYRTHGVTAPRGGGVGEEGEGGGRLASCDVDGCEHCYRDRPQPPQPLPKWGLVSQGPNGVQVSYDKSIDTPAGFCYQGWFRMLGLPTTLYVSEQWQQC